MPCQLGTIVAQIRLPLLRACNFILVQGCHMPPGKACAARSSHTSRVILSLCAPCAGNFSAGPGSSIYGAPSSLPSYQAVCAEYVWCSYCTFFITPHIVVLALSNECVLCIYIFTRDVSYRRLRRSMRSKTCKIQHASFITRLTIRSPP